MLGSVQRLIMQNINKRRMGSKVWDERMNIAGVHLSFVCEFYKIQARSGRDYLHGHPTTAGS